MKRDDWMLFSLTFLTGLALGMYVYIGAFKPIYAPEDLTETEADASEWSIVGKRYGGNTDAEYIQPSFRVLSDGSYTYLKGGRSAAALEPELGKLPSVIRRDLQVAADEVVKAARAPGKTTCTSDQGGYDYEYKITLAGDTYVLDSCLTTLGYDSELAVSLQNIWKYLEGEAPAGMKLRGDTPSEWLENWLYNALHRN